jgi:hypothetical protein
MNDLKSRMSIAEGDITKLDVEAIVNAANSPAVVSAAPSIAPQDRNSPKPARRSTAAPPARLA